MRSKKKENVAVYYLCMNSPKFAKYIQTTPERNLKQALKVLFRVYSAITSVFLITFQVLNYFTILGH